MQTLKIKKVVDDLNDIVTVADPFASSEQSGKAFVSDLLWLVEHARSLSKEDYVAVCGEMRKTYGPGV